MYNSFFHAPQTSVGSLTVLDVVVTLPEEPGIVHETLPNLLPREPVSEIPGALKVPATSPEQSELLKLTIW